MPGWDKILKEIGDCPSGRDTVRRKYLRILSNYTKRNAIAYYSGFLTQPGSPQIDINDSDMLGFMNSTKGLDTTKGLDLILHTPGGNPTACEAIVTYLRSKYDTDIRVIVPHMAMSAGTMMACAAKVIIMGKQSSLGPIDPQINGIPAYNIIREYETAKDELSQPDGATRMPIWQIALSKYPPAFVLSCQDAIELSNALTKDWLLTGMFLNAEDSKNNAKRIVNFLNEHADSKSHARHYDYHKCRSVGLNVQLLEDDQKLQDCVLSVHHAFSLTFSSTSSVKIIENHLGNAVVLSAAK